MPPLPCIGTGSATQSRWSGSFSAGPMATASRAIPRHGDGHGRDVAAYVALPCLMAAAAALRH
jgi:hypothetical protein